MTNFEYNNISLSTPFICGLTVSHIVTNLLKLFKVGAVELWITTYNYIEFLLTTSSVTIFTLKGVSKSAVCGDLKVRMLTLPPSSPKTK